MKCYEFSAFFFPFSFSFSLPVHNFLFRLSYNSPTRNSMLSLSRHLLFQFHLLHLRLFTDLLPFSLRPLVQQMALQFKFLQIFNLLLFMTTLQTSFNVLPLTTRSNLINTFHRSHSCRNHIAIVLFDNISTSFKLEGGVLWRQIDTQTTVSNDPTTHLQERENGEQKKSSFVWKSDIEN
jgi:hypothetical protein